MCLVLIKDEIFIKKFKLKGLKVKIVKLIRLFLASCAVIFK